MYHHYLRRTSVVAAPAIQALVQHYQQYRDDPSAPPLPNVTAKEPLLAWRLLTTEAIRAARDRDLAPHFALSLLSPSPSTPLPIPSLRVFNLPPAILFCLASHSLAAPKILPPTHPAVPLIRSTVEDCFQPTMELLRSTTPFWSNPLSAAADEITSDEAVALIASLYPGSGDDPRPTPINSRQRAVVLSSLTIKFSSPGIILQSLSAFSPGGAPGSPHAIPLEDVLFELGETLTADEDTVETIAQRWLLPLGPDIGRGAANAIHGLAAGLREGRGVDLHGVIKGLSAVEGVSFASVLQSFDLPDSGRPSLDLLRAMLLFPPQQPVPPIAGLVPATLDTPMWSNTLPLLNLLLPLVHLHVDHLPLFLLPNSAPPSTFYRVVKPATDTSMSKQARQEANDLQKAGIFNCLGLYQVLVDAFRRGEDLGESSAHISRAASEALQQATAVAPALCLLAFEQLQMSSGSLPEQIAQLHSRLVNMYSTDLPKSLDSWHVVWQMMWRNSNNYVLSVLQDLYAESEANLGSILNIALELKIIPTLLELDNLQFVFDFAALAGVQKKLDFERWLATGIAVRGELFLQALYDFVDTKVRIEMDQRHLPKHSTLGDEVYSVIIRVVRNSRDLSADAIKRFKDLRTDILILRPRLLVVRPGSKDEQGFVIASFDREANEEVRNMISQMFCEELKIDDVVNELKRSADENIEFFDCAIHFLLDEYEYIGEYPHDKATMTGILFGAIIDYRLLKDIPAFVATRYVLDACKTSVNDPLYVFGINALSVLRGSLIDFPGLCRSLLEIPALHEAHPILINDINAALAEYEDIRAQGGVKLAFPALRLPILIEEGDDEYREPEPARRDAMMFAMNQIAPTNVHDKSADLAELFEPRYSRWFAHYLVDLRVSLEMNRHDIYLQLLERIDSPVLDRHVLWETYRKARDLVNSEETLASQTERATLKNIALWLGRLTLARDKPIKLLDLNMKDLLIQGYDNHRLIVAIPFVTNIMHACKQSTVFHPPNPWLNAMLTHLVEFYTHGELRLNTKFEIEVLFTKLEIVIESIEPSSVLRKHVPPPQPQPEAPNRLELEFQRALVAGVNRFEPPNSEIFTRMQESQLEQAAQATHRAFEQRVEELIADVMPFLQFNEEWAIFTAPTTKRVVQHSVERAISDVIGSVVDRSVTIAGISSCDLVSKDFGTEADATKLRHAAHGMVQFLAGNLATVTCKDQLRSTMINNIRGMLNSNGFTDDNMPDAMIAGVVNDNLDLACSVIAKAATERALKDIDVNLSGQLSARKAHQGSSDAFRDSNSFAVNISKDSVLPDPLRLIAGGLTTPQRRVYAEFSAYQLTNGYAGDHDRMDATEARSVSDQFLQLIGEIEKNLSTNTAPTVSTIEGDSELFALMRSIVLLANGAAEREQTIHSLSQRLVQLLYTTSSPLGREIYAILLGEVCNLAPQVGKDVRSWFIYAEDTNLPVTITLLRSGFLSVTDLDTALASLRPSADTLDFAASIIRECVIQGQPRAAFGNTLAAMVKAKDHGVTTPGVDRLLDDLRGPRLSQAVVDRKLEDHLAHFFFEWVRVSTSTKEVNRVFLAYIAYLQKEGILKGDDVSTAFYRTAISCAVDHDEARAENYVAADAFAKLVVLIVRHQGGNKGNESAMRQSYYFNKVISIVSYCLVERQLSGDFDQRVWSRIFTSTLAELATMESHAPEAYARCLQMFANALGIIQPMYAPSFAFGWVGIVAHRLFLPKILEYGPNELHRCLQWLLRFLAPFLQADEMSDAARMMYKATMRIFVVIMHDFPDFLDEYYHTLSAAIPMPCMQLRNIVLTAFPSSVSPLPDPYGGIEYLSSSMQTVPRVRLDYMRALDTGNVKNAIDQYTQTGIPPQTAIAQELKNRVVVKTMSEDGPQTTWNHTLLHAVVFYLGTSAVEKQMSATGVASFDRDAPEVALLLEFLMTLGPEGHYYTLGVIVDQLRYPSAHTLFFASLLLRIFSVATASDATIDLGERIARVLLERVCGSRPHPWGLVVTFIELLDNEAYGFWRQPFIRAEEEIHMLFLRAHGNFAVRR